MNYLKIPKERVAVLIGTDGIIKRRLEKAFDVKLKVDPEGQVEVDSSKSADKFKAYKVGDAIKAIGRGFAPIKALDLVRDDYILEILDLEELLPNDRAVVRQKSRLIGSEGRARENIEKTLGINMSVYGNTVSLLGPEKEVRVGVEAIEKLISGAMHSTMFKFIQKRMQEGNEQW